MKVAFGFRLSVDEIVSLREMDNLETPLWNDDLAYRFYQAIRPALPGAGLDGPGSGALAYCATLALPKYVEELQGFFAFVDSMAGRRALQVTQLRTERDIRTREQILALEVSVDPAEEFLVTDARGRTTRFYGEDARRARNPENYINTAAEEAAATPKRRVRIRRN